ncbi:MAG: hypothetical protein ABIF08_04555 [Nanoarchaeota archaeon]
MKKIKSFLNRKFSGMALQQMLLLAFTIIIAIIAFSLWLGFSGNLGPEVKEGITTWYNSMFGDFTGTIFT